MADEDEERVLFFEFDGLTFVARDCYDIDRIEQKAGFTSCPICGGVRVFENGVGLLEHDDSYSDLLH